MVPRQLEAGRPRVGSGPDDARPGAAGTDQSGELDRVHGVRLGRRDWAGAELRRAGSHQRVQWSTGGHGCEVELWEDRWAYRYVSGGNTTGL